MSDPTPTYRVEKQDDGTEQYTCLYCEQGGQEHHARDLDLFKQHMIQRHNGVMTIEPAPKGDRAAANTVRKTEAKVAEKQHETEAGAKSGTA